MLGSSTTKAAYLIKGVDGKVHRHRRKDKENQTVEGLKLEWRERELPPFCCRRKGKGICRCT